MYLSVIYHIYVCVCVCVCIYIYIYMYFIYIKDKYTVRISYLFVSVYILSSHVSCWLCFSGVSWLVHYFPRLESQPWKSFISEVLVAFQMSTKRKARLNPKGRLSSAQVEFLTSSCLEEGALRDKSLHVMPLVTYSGMRPSARHSTESCRPLKTSTDGFALRHDSLLQAQSGPCPQS